MLTNKCSWNERGVSLLSDANNWFILYKKEIIKVCDQPKYKKMSIVPKDSHFICAPCAIVWEVWEAQCPNQSLNLLPQVRVEWFCTVFRFLKTYTFLSIRYIFTSGKVLIYKKSQGASNINIFKENLHKPAFSKMGTTVFISKRDLLFLLFLFLAHKTSTNMSPPKKRLELKTVNIFYGSVTS